MFRQLHYCCHQVSRSERRKVVKYRSFLCVKTRLRPSCSFQPQFNIPCRWHSRRFLSVVHDDSQSTTESQTMDRLLEEDETAQKGFYEPTKDRFSEKDGFLNFFVDRVQANVDTMISLVDGGKEGQRLDGMTKGSIARNEKQLSQRWRNSMKIETERFRRRNGLVKKPLHKMTLEEQWDEVLSESSLPFSNSLVENLVDGNDSSSEAYDVVTPIFGFRTEEGRLLNIDLDNIMNDGSRHISNQSSAENAEYEPTPSPFDDGPRVTKRDVERQIDSHTESILRTIALFYAITKKEWAMIDRNKDWEFEIGAVDSENALQLDEVHDFQGDNQGEDEADQHEIDQVHELMRDIRSKKYHLTTTESNLLLAKILTSMDTPVDIMLSQSLQLYGEMKLLRETGREESGPDATTYRMLILALSRRMMALGEAVSLSQEMMESSVELTPEAFLDGMHACISKSDMDAAWKMIFFARNDHQGKPFRPSIAAYALMLEMMKQRNLQEDAIDLFKRVEELSDIGSKDKDRLLLSLCHWPTKSRRGDFIDVAPLLLQVLDVVNGKLINEEKPGFVVWSTLVDKLSRATVHDSSLWSDIGRAIRAMLEGYPTYAPSLNLIRIGLTASESTTDADLASKIVKRKVAKVVLPPPLGAEEAMLKETESWDDNNSSGSDHLENSDLIVQEFEHSIGPAPVPHQAFRRALQTSLRASDTKSAACIIESFTQVSTAYPLGAQADLFSLALLCFAQGNDVKNAKRLLLKMVEANMKPSDDLFGAVLHGLVVAGKTDEAQELFHSMESGENFNGVRPGVSCYNAIILNHVRLREWDKVIAVHEAMKEKNIAVTPQTIQGLVLAYSRKGGKAYVTSLLETLRDDGACIDENTFKLLTRVLLPEIEGTLEKVRKRVRDIGESNPQLRGAALDLMRSLRTAEIEEHRRNTKNMLEADFNVRKKEAWRSVLVYFLEFVRQSSEV